MTFPSESSPGPAPYEIIRLEGDEILGRIKRFPTFHYGHETLAGAFQSFIQMDKGLIFLAGVPRSGKSFSVMNFNWQVQNHQIGIRYPHFFNSLSWEDAEDRARANGLITTPNEAPFTPTELRHCNRMARELLATSIDSYQITTFEVPAITSELKLGRDLGTTAIDEVTARSVKRYKELPKEYSVRGIGLIGGPLMQLLTMYYRRDMKATQSFEDGLKVAKLYGQAIPGNEEVWVEMKHEGASVDQIQRIEQQLDELLDELERRALIPPVSNDYVEHVFDFNIREQTEGIGLSADVVMKTLRRELRTANLTKYKFEKWKIPSEHGGIFFNNPSLADLHITSDDQIRQIRERITQDPIAA